MSPPNSPNPQASHSDQNTLLQTHPRHTAEDSRIDDIYKTPPPNFDFSWEYLVSRENKKANCTKEYGTPPAPYPSRGKKIVTAHGDESIPPRYRRVRDPPCCSRNGSCGLSQLAIQCASTNRIYDNQPFLGPFHNKIGEDKRGGNVENLYSPSVFPLAVCGVEGDNGPVP